mgnify:CR=1 FL=1
MPEVPGNAMEPVFQLIFISHFSSSASKVSGCSENSLSESMRSFTGAAITPSDSTLSGIIVEVMVVSRSDAVTFRLPSFTSNRK